MSRWIVLNLEGKHQIYIVKLNIALPIEKGREKELQKIHVNDFHHALYFNHFAMKDNLSEKIIRRKRTVHYGVTANYAVESTSSGTRRDWSENCELAEERTRPWHRRNRGWPSWSRSTFRKLQPPGISFALYRNTNAHLARADVSVLCRLETPSSLCEKGWVERKGTHDEKSYYVEQNVSAVFGL